MPNFRQGIADLPSICYELGIRHLVVSPGSRNVPLIKSFSRFGKIKLTSVIDERSAAYTALGIGISTQQAVGIVCTSGTAALNYHAAISEAYYQKIPLVVFTADRPPEWVDQGDGQTIKQSFVFNEFVARSFQLPVDTKNDEDYWFFNRSISEAVNIAKISRTPVHINIPLREPIYTDLPEIATNTCAIHAEMIHSTSQEIPSHYIKLWQKAARKIILIGMQHATPTYADQIIKLAQDPSVVVMAENLANIQDKNILDNHDVIIHQITTSLNQEEFRPELVIQIGGPILSKKLKQWLRKNWPDEFWRISSEPDFTDTFQSLKRNIICGDIPGFISELANLSPHQQSLYSDSWCKIQALANQTVNDYVKTVGIADIAAIKTIIENIPKPANLHLGNSTPVRYAQLFPSRNGIQYFANRGTSGIDGCISTMAGYALANPELSVLLVGDVSFHYDSNGLALLKKLKNAKIFVMNNDGGNIFKIIEKENHNKDFETLLTTPPGISIKKMVEAYGLEYFYADNLETLNSKLPDFFEQTDTASVFEINTKHKENARIFKGLFQTNS